MRPSLFLILIILFAIVNACTSNSFDSLSLSNEKLEKKFSFKKNGAGAIDVEIIQKESSKTINRGHNNSYFEFVVNNQKVSSSDDLWVSEDYSIRQMGNGGTEHTLVFKGVKPPVEGLKVFILQQMFPNSTLMREKLVLKTESQSFTLNKLNGELHFKFPCYSIDKKAQSAKSTEIKIASWEEKPITFGNKRKGNHMYYPKVTESILTKGKQIVKGPVSIVTNGEISWFSAYEHASQDNLNGMFNEQKLGSGNLINDAMQGTKGVFNFPINEKDFSFLGISNEITEDQINVSVDVLRGGYLDGEVIDKDHPYSTVWTATGFYDGDNLEEGKFILRNYLFNQICEKPASRQPEFYYNTWGMQRNDKTKPLRGILTYDRIFEEIEYAAELGVDIFVLDDGWENAQGEWFPNKERLTEGLAPIKERLDKHGIKMGLWYSPMGIDSTKQRYKDYKKWVILDSEDNPILAQWNHPAFDFVSGFFNLFVDECKQMIDEGCRFMKWDAVNTFYSSLPNLDHGSDQYSKEELRARYEYLLPIYVVRAMEILTDYEPELIIEMDVTEARRVMVGLAPLSQGKMFWMNNGASWYNDYSAFRTQSMRTIANEFAGIVPLELFTYANYPHNIRGKMKYNIHNSLLAGHGFWGNLQLMNSEERKWIGSQVKLSKRVLPYLVDVNPQLKGKVGDSPEIYSIVNENESAGQVILFSEEPYEQELTTKIEGSKLLAVVNQPYSLKDNQLQFSFSSNEKQSSKAVIVLPNDNKGISIISSTSVITGSSITKNGLEYDVASPGEQIILWDKKQGKPIIEDSNAFDFEIIEEGEVFEIKILIKEVETKVSIKSIS